MRAAYIAAAGLLGALSGIFITTYALPLAPDEWEAFARRVVAVHTAAWALLTGTCVVVFYKKH